MLHVAALPLCPAAGIVLVATGSGRAVAVGGGDLLDPRLRAVRVSALDHLGPGSPARHRLLERLDDAEIYLIIAGTYTPFAAAATRPARAAILSIVWGRRGRGRRATPRLGAAAAWRSMSLYVALGWVAALGIPNCCAAQGCPPWCSPSSAGSSTRSEAVVYATRRPDPAPRVFGFHEAFHALTVAAFATQYVAVSLSSTGGRGGGADPGGGFLMFGSAEGGPRAGARSAETCRSARRSRPAADLQDGPEVEAQGDDDDGDRAADPFRCRR